MFVSFSWVLLEDKLSLKFLKLKIQADHVIGDRAVTRAQREKFQFSVPSILPNSHISNVCEAELVTNHGYGNCISLQLPAKSVVDLLLPYGVVVVGASAIPFY